jgi:hypothetical protein
VTLIAADDRAYLTTTHGARYALGDPDNPALTLNAADLFGCMWACDVPEGWDSPEVNTPMDRRPTGHGGYAGEPTYEPRVLAFEGTVTAPTAEDLTAAHARWLTALLGPLPAMWRYTHLDETPVRGLWVYPSGKPKWRALDDRVAEFAFVLVAEDPIKTGTAAAYGPVRLPTAGGEGGVAYPLSFPVTYSAGTVGSTVAHVANDGDEDAHAVYTITGPLPGPQVLLSTGEHATLTADLPTGNDVAVIDTATGTVTINGADRFDAWAAGSTFPLIPPGGADVRLRSTTGGTDQAAYLTVTSAPAWK